MSRISFPDCTATFDAVDAMHVDLPDSYRLARTGYSRMIKTNPLKNYFLSLSDVKVFGKRTILKNVSVQLVLEPLNQCKDTYAQRCLKPFN